VEKENDRSLSFFAGGRDCQRLRCRVESLLTGLRQDINPRPEIAGIRESRSAQRSERSRNKSSQTLPEISKMNHEICRPSPSIESAGGFITAYKLP